jgi:non-specific serine/threonine protein kinase/serine/threonine-protein kinase
MTPEHYQKMMQVLDAVIDCDPDRREFLLNEACSEDQQLRCDVEKLLTRHEPAVEFMEEPPIAVIAGLRDDAEGRYVIGKRFGPYLISREIGRGGMGAVYLAVRDDEVFQKEVAIKLIKRGMDSDFILRRFRNERQILANLNHPNIARFYNAGTTEDGLPFFVMEYVDGVPINQYCLTHKLSVVERLKLFRAVCAAVHYAHQNLVVHRDLKPTNILVTDDGEPKLLDFGIAKLLNQDHNEQLAEMTATEFRVMTPDYASPEQIRGIPVTTATDVYSLGVILYELLTGNRPYGRAGRRPDEMARLICEQEPAKPSQFVAVSSAALETLNAKSEIVSSKLLRGDIDNIVIMAMKKEVNRRYASVDQLSEDIRRHLESRPVHARKDTITYRGWSFIKRNKLGVAAVTLVILSLLGGIVATAWQAHVARMERAKAERRFNDVHKLANSFLFEFQDSIKDVPGTLAARQRFLQKGLESLDSLAEEAGDDKVLHSELASAYERIGSLTFDVNKSLESHRKALAINQLLVKAEPSNTKYCEQLAGSYEYIANLLKQKGETSAALENYEKGLSLTESLSANHPANLIYLSNLVETHNQIGTLLAEIGRPGPAMKHVERSQAIAETLEKAEPDNLQYRLNRVMTYLLEGMAHADGGNYSAALNSYNKAAALCDSLIAADSADSIFQLTSWSVRRHLGEAALQMHEPRQALTHYQSALEVIEPLAKADPADAGHGHHLSITYLGVGRALAAMDQKQAALENYSRATAISEGLLAKDPNKAETRDDLARIYTATGSLLVKTKDFDHGRKLLQKAGALLEELLNADPSNERLRRSLSEASEALP